MYQRVHRFICSSCFSVLSRSLERGVERVEETTSVSCSRSFISSDILQKMSAPNASEDDLSLASQCLALCQTLAGQGKAFSISVTVGSTFTFSLDSKETASLPKKKKKSSPSTLRRNAARREKFLKRKVEPPSIMEAPNPIQCPPVISHTSVPFSAMEAMLESFKCDQSDDRFVSNQGLICHTEAAHKVNLHVAPHPLQCTHCGQSFLSEQDLKVHSTSAHASKLSSNLPFHSSPYQHLIPESWG